MLDPVSTAATKQITQVINNAFDSPSKEIGNFIADKIRYLRYSSLLKIIQRAEERAQQAGMLLKMPPLKFFVPFAEGASLEEPKQGDKSNSLDDLQELWAKLLVQSSSDYDSRHGIFVRILKKITSNEVAFLRRLVEGSRATTRWIGSTWSYADSSVLDPRHYAHFATKIKFLADQDIAQLVIDCFESPGVMFYAVSSGTGKPYDPSEETSYRLISDYHSDHRRAAHAVLIGLGLIKEFQADYMYYDDLRFIDVSGIHLTELGIDFLQTCSDFREEKAYTSQLEIDPGKGEIRVVPFE